MPTPSKYICPNCKAKEGVNILYGMPSPELFEKAERGEIALGGCVIEENQPDRRCLKCNHEWQIKPRQ
jgi:Zn finger protein HypA/HybF involved in hydrogenase expression